MKITREAYRAANGVSTMAFIRANPIERFFLRRAWRAGRHNLRPSRNWPGLRRHGASYVLCPKGAWNPDTGRRPGLPRWVEVAIEPRFTTIDAAYLGLSIFMPYWWLQLGLPFCGFILSRSLQSWKIRHETPNRL